MNRLRTVLCASFVVVAHLPALLRAQAATPEVSRSAVGAELQLVIPSSVPVYLFGRMPRRPVAGLWRGWLQDSVRTSRPMPVVLPFDSTVAPTLECPMPVARLAPEAIPRMPTAPIDSAGAAPRVLPLRGCTNPLDRRPY
jgi:hypothetical protein